MKTDNNDQEDDSRDDIVTILESAPMETIYQQDKALIDTQIATAKAYPRDIVLCTNDAIATVTMDEEIAASCTYALPRGGKPLVGPSVHIARILAQNWGHLRFGARVINVDDKHVTAQGICFDLQKNISITVEVKRSILQNEYRNGQRTGQLIRMNDDMITVTGNAANAIALRNAILNVIPKSVVDKVHKAAKEKVTGDVSNPKKLIAKVRQILKVLLDSYKVAETEALASLGKASVDNITIDDLIVLIGVIQSIKDGDTTVDQAFRLGRGKRVSLKKEDQEKRHKEQLKRISSLLGKLGDAVPADQIDGLKRIVKEKETKSYDKAEKYLDRLDKSSKPKPE